MSDSLPETLESSFLISDQISDPLTNNKPNQYSQHGLAKPVPIAARLPHELLVHIFCYLTPDGLDCASQVCKTWHLSVDEATWKACFQQNFHCISKFNRSSPTLSWRTELVTRLDYLHKWRKGHCNNLSFNACVWDISHVFADFAANRITCFSQMRGVGTIADPTRGKLSNKRVFTTKALQIVADTSCVDGSRFGLIYGFYGGRVSAVIFSHETRLRDYILFRDAVHFGDVTSVWITKDQSPRNTGIAALSGGEDGHVFHWSLTDNRLVKDYTVSVSNDGDAVGMPIIHLDSNGSVVVCMSQNGSIYILLPGAEEFELITQYKGPLRLEQTFFFVDYVSNFGIFASHDMCVRYKLEPDSPLVELTQARESPSTFTAMNIDKTYFPVNLEAPGSNARCLAAATEDNHVFVWRLQDQVDRNGTIRPMRVSQSPFQANNNAPTVTALALNPVVLLLGSYNGVTVATDLLTGDYLRVVSSRFSKRALNLRVTDDPDSLHAWPTTQLELDPDPYNPHGIIVVRSAIQYFDLGAELEKSTVKKKGVKKRNRIPFTGDGQSSSARTSRLTSRQIQDEMGLGELGSDEEGELSQLDNRATDYQSMSEEDQLNYALMLSNENPEDEDLRRALELSANDTTSHEYSFGSSGHSHEADGDSDEEFRRALELSLEGSFDSHASSHPAESYYHDDDRNANYDDDEDLEMALRLSLVDQ